MFTPNLTPNSMSTRIFLLTLVVVFWMSAFSSYAQQDVLTGQYLFNGMLVNPAYAGASGQWETMAMQRLQWVDFDGAPNTGIVSGHGTLGDRELGVGGMSHWMRWASRPRLSFQDTPPTTSTWEKAI